MAGMYGCFRGRNSDSAAMASEPPDVMTNQEPAEVQEECSGKKKSKFQTFKKFFARKKRKDPTAAGADSGLKASQSSDNVSKASENNTLTRSEKEKGSGSKISLGSKALSHDSVFVSDSSEANEALGASQDSIHGKVKSLQLQLKQAIRLGSPPSLMCVKRTEDAGTMSEDDGLPCSPPEYTTLHTVMNQAERNSSISLEGMDSDDDQLSCAASSRAVSPLVVPGDFSQPASPFGCLDNSAAKHKLGLRHKACNKRKPANRLEGRAEGGSAVEDMLTASIPEAETEAMEEQKQLRTEDGSGDKLKPKVESREEEEEEEEEAQHSIQSQLRDKEQREEQEDESEAEQDVCHSPDTSCPPEPSLSEEGGSDAEPSSEHDSRTSSPDSPSVTPKPPAGHREYLLDPPGISYGAEENKVHSDLSSGEEEEDEGQEKREEEEESSLLQEVLSSLKTPLASHSLDVEAEGIVLEMKEEEDVEDGEEVKEEEVEEANHQAVPSCAIMSGQTAVEEEELTASWNVEEALNGSNEEEEEEEDKAEEEDEDPVLERFIQDSPDEEEQAEDIKPEEEKDLYTRQTVSHTGEEEEEEESEGEEEAIELEKEPEVEEEGQEKTEEEEVDEGRGVEEAVEAMEEEKGHADEVTEMFPYVQNDTPIQEADEDVELETDPTKHVNDDGIPAEIGDQVMEEGQERSGDEREEEEEKQKSDQEEDIEVNRTGTDQTEEELKRESVTITPDSYMKEVKMDPSEASEQAVVSPKPSSLSLCESPPESHPQHNEASTPSKTSTTSIHINLVSPSSEKATSVFQLPPTAADPRDSASESPSPDVEAHTASTHKEQVDSVEESRATQEQEAATPVSVEETVNQPLSTVDQSKPRFTIAPAWQRSQSLTPPSSPPPCDSSSSEPIGEEVEAATKKDPGMKAESVSPAKVELVLSPSRARNITAKPQSSAALAPVKAQTSVEESSVVVEGNPDSPFGVRLRKTSALFRFNSEEENTEPSVESAPQPTSCKVDSPQPVSVKPSVCPPVSTKPALPKKPEVHGDSGGKPKWISDPAAGRGASVGSDGPSWISVAKQKQKIYKENSLDDITVKKEEEERKSSLPMYVSSAASRELSSKVGHLEITKPSVSAEKEARRSLSPPTPVPPQPSKSQPLPCPVAPKPQPPPVAAKHPLPPTPPQRSLSPPTPVPVSQKSPSCTSPQSPSKTATSPTVTSPPFSSRAAPEKSAQRGIPAAALPQDEPPWMALAKKKAKAWSEMPQIVQ